MSNALTRLVHHIAYDLLIPETSQRLVSTAALGSLRAFEFAEDDNSFSSRPSNSSTIYSSAASLFRRLSASKAAQPFKTSLPRTISTTEPISKELESPSELRIGSLKDYIGLRKRNVAGVLDLSPRDWLHIISWATGANGNEVDQSMLNDIAKDLVRCAAHGQSDYQYPIISMLKYAAEGTHGTSISHDQVLELFHALPSSLDLASSLSSTLIIRILQAILDQPYFPLYQSFFQSAFPILLEKSSVPIAAGNSHQRMTQNRETGVLLRLMEKVTQGEYPQEAFALKLFSSLSSANRIPSSVIKHASKSLVAMKQAGSSPSETIRHVMLEVCSLTCFKWGWHAEGLRFLRPLLRTQDVFALLQERKSEPTLQSPQMIVNVPNIHATSDPSPLSPSAIRLILKIIRSRLSLATSTDFNAATALILGYGRVAATNPSVPPLPQDLLGEYWAMALQFDPSGAVSTLVYIHLTAIKEWNLLRVPPMEVALAVLGNLIQAGKVASAERLIEDILQLGNIGTRCGTSPIPASVVVSPLLVAKAIQVGRHDLAQEIWRRARNRWEGYPYASICGDRRVVRALFKSLEPSLTSGVDTSFHASVLNTFVRTRPQNTQLISQLDVNVFNQCWRILRRASGQNMPKLPRMKQRRVRTAATRLRRLEASRSHNPHNVRRMYVATRTLQQRTG